MQVLFFKYIMSFSYSFWNFNSLLLPTCFLDICTLYLQGKSIDVKFLKEDVEAFDNPEKHFTKEYRILEGLCNKLLLDLDKIEVIGRDDLKEPRKQALKEVNEILTKLEAKVHESGDACEDCEIKN